MKDKHLKRVVEGYLISRSADGLSDNSLAINEWALSRLIDYAGNIDIDKIDADVLRGFMNFMRRDYSPTRSNGDTSPLAGSSIDRIWIVIRAFFHWTELEYGTSRPDMRLPRPRYKPEVIKPFTQDEIKALLNAAEYSALVSRPGQKPFRMKRPTADRDVALIFTLLDTGIRASECARLVMGDLDLELGEITIRPFGSSVKSKPRIVYLGKSSRRAVWRYISDRQWFEDDPLFQTSKGKPMDRNIIRKLLVNIGNRASVNNTHPHRFRHTFAIEYLRNSGDIFTLQRLLGHSSLKMVKNYLDIAGADDKNVHRRASPADRWSL